MEEERGNVVETPPRVTEPLITVPNPRAIQQQQQQQQQQHQQQNHNQNQNHNNNHNHIQNQNQNQNHQQSVTVPTIPGQSKYGQLLAVIEELGRDIRPSYAGSRSSAERIKRGIVHARILVRECLVETEKSARQFREMPFFTLDTFDTEYSADSVEFCPIEPFQDIFVCGTYQLKENEEVAKGSKRIGRIYLFSITKGGKLKELQRLEVPAVLDMKWSHSKFDEKICLGVANALGYLQIYELTSNCLLKLRSETKIDQDQDQLLALSLDWSWSEEGSSVRKIAVSDSKGQISLFDLTENGLKKVRNWVAHEFEAWIVAFDYWDSNVLFTGGDDCKFQKFDNRLGPEAVVLNRTHEAGVTSLQSNRRKEFLLASGSYDEKLRLWDTRNIRRPISTLNLAGGIWRLKWEPIDHNHLFAACMYGGFKVIDCTSDSDPSIVGEYHEHESIAYGADWSLLTSDEIFDKQICADKRDKVSIMGTCSFYDHILKLSSFTFDFNCK